MLCRQSLRPQSLASEVADKPHQARCWRPSSNRTGNRIVQCAGYSPQTFGDWAGTAVTATELQARSKTTQQTRNARIQHWRPALQLAIYSLMCIEKLYFGNTEITPEYPDIEFPHHDIQDPLQLAQTASLPP